MCRKACRDVDGYAGHDAGRYRARLAGGGRGYARQHERRRVVDLRREFARCMAAGWRFRAVPRYGIEDRRRGLAWRGRRCAQRGRTGACAGAGRRARGSWPGGDAKQRDGAGGFTGREHRRRAAALLESGHLTVDGSVVHGHGAAGLEVDGESNVSLLNGARLSSDQPTAIRLIDPRSVLNLDIKDRAQLLGDIAPEAQQPDGSPEQARVRVALADGDVGGPHGRRGPYGAIARSWRLDRDGRFPGGRGQAGGRHAGVCATCAAQGRFQDTGRDAGHFRYGHDSHECTFAQRHGRCAGGAAGIRRPAGAGGQQHG